MRQGGKPGAVHAVVVGFLRAVLTHVARERQAQHFFRRMDLVYGSENTGRRGEVVMQAVRDEHGAFDPHREIDGIVISAGFVHFFRIAPAPGLAPPHRKT